MGHINTGLSTVRTALEAGPVAPRGQSRQLGSQGSTSQAHTVLAAFFGISHHSLSKTPDITGMCSPAWGGRFRPRGGQGPPAKGSGEASQGWGGTRPRSQESLQDLARTIASLPPSPEASGHLPRGNSASLPSVFPEPQDPVPVHGGRYYKECRGNRR